MLLDDVTSELDAERRALLVEHSAGRGQALITATEPEQLPRRRPTARDRDRAPAATVAAAAVSAAATAA